MSAFSLFDTLSVQEDDEDIFMSTIDLNVNELNWNVNHLNLLCNHSGVIPRTSKPDCRNSCEQCKTRSDRELNNIVTNADSRNTKANT